MSTTTTRRTSEGAASTARLHEAWRTGALRVTPTTPAIHLRSAPHLHLVHRVDTETDLPDGADGVAIGDTATTSEHNNQNHSGLTGYAIAGIYAATAAALALVVVASRHQPQIEQGLRIARRAVELFLLGD